MVEIPDIKEIYKASMPNYNIKNLLKRFLDEEGTIEFEEYKDELRLLIDDAFTTGLSVARSVIKHKLTTNKR